MGRTIQKTWVTGRKPMVVPSGMLHTNSHVLANADVRPEKQNEFRNQLAEVVVSSMVLRPACAPVSAVRNSTTAIAQWHLRIPPVKTNANIGRNPLEAKLLTQSTRANAVRNENKMMRGQLRAWHRFGQT